MYWNNEQCIVQPNPTDSVGTVLKSQQLHYIPTKHSSCVEFPRPGLSGCVEEAGFGVISLMTVNGIPPTIFTYCLLTVWGQNGTLISHSSSCSPCISNEWYLIYVSKAGCWFYFPCLFPEIISLSWKKISHVTDVFVQDCLVPAEVPGSLRSRELKK